MNNLNEQQIKNIKQAMELIARAGGLIREPVDPKVEGQLEIAYAMLNEQIKLDKKYDWGPPAPRDDRFLEDSEIITPEELRRMVEGDET